MVCTKCKSEMDKGEGYIKGNLQQGDKIQSEVVIYSCPTCDSTIVKPIHK